MNKFFLISLCFIGLQNLCGQDSIRAVNIFRHEIVNGKPTVKKSILKQKTYNHDEQIVLEILYDSVPPQVIRFTRFYYEDNKLISKESFSQNNEPVKIIRYEYNEKEELMTKRIYLPGKKTMERIKTIQFQYRDGKSVQKIILNNKGKWISKSETGYFDNMEVETLKYNKRYEDSLKSVVITRNYTHGTEIRESRYQTYKDKREKLIQIDNTFNEKEQLTEKKWTEEDQIVKRVEYYWFPDGTLNRKNSFNGDDQLTESLSCEYLKRNVVLSGIPMFDLEEPIPGK